MSSQSAGRRRSNMRQYSAEDQALNMISKEAESRLAAKRAARAEAREIRLKEMEKQHKESEAKQDRVYELTNEHNSVKNRQLVGSRSGSRRGSTESNESEAKDLDFKMELRELEEKYKAAMMTSAQLDNEKQSLVYQVELLKDQMEEQDESLTELQRQYKDKCRDFDFQKRDLQSVQNELSILKQQMEIKDRLIEESGFVILANDHGEPVLTKQSSGSSSSNGPLPSGAVLVSQETKEFLEKAGGGTLGTGTPDVHTNTISVNNKANVAASRNVSDPSVGAYIRCKEHILENEGENLEIKKQNDSIAGSHHIVDAPIVPECPGSSANRSGSETEHEGSADVVPTNVTVTNEHGMIVVSDEDGGPTFSTGNMQDSKMPRSGESDDGDEFYDTVTTPSLFDEVPSFNIGLEDVEKPPQVSSKIIGKIGSPQNMANVDCGNEAKKWADLGDAKVELQGVTKSESYTEAGADSKDKDGADLASAESGAVMLVVEETVVQSADIIEPDADMDLKGGAGAGENIKENTKANTDKFSENSEVIVEPTEREEEETDGSYEKETKAILSYENTEGQESQMQSEVEIGCKEGKCVTSSQKVEDTSTFQETQKKSDVTEEKDASGLGDKALPIVPDEVDTSLDITFTDRDSDCRDKLIAVRGEEDSDTLEVYASGANGDKDDQPSKEDKVTGHDTPYKDDTNAELVEEESFQTEDKSEKSFCPPSQLYDDPLPEVIGKDNAVECDDDDCKDKDDAGMVADCATEVPLQKGKVDDKVDVDLEASNLSNPVLSSSLLEDENNVGLAESKDTDASGVFDLNLSKVDSDVLKDSGLISDCEVDSGLDNFKKSLHDSDVKNMAKETHLEQGEELQESLAVCSIDVDESEASEGEGLHNGSDYDFDDIDEGLEVQDSPQTKDCFLENNSMSEAGGVSKDNPENINIEKGAKPKKKKGTKKMVKQDSDKSSFDGGKMESLASLFKSKHDGREEGKSLSKTEPKKSKKHKKDQKQAVTESSLSVDAVDEAAGSEFNLSKTDLCNKILEHDGTEEGKSLSKTEAKREKSKKNKKDQKQAMTGSSLSVDAVDVAAGSELNLSKTDSQSSLEPEDLEGALDKHMNEAAISKTHKKSKKLGFFKKVFK